MRIFRLRGLLCALVMVLGAVAHLNSAHALTGPNSGGNQIPEIANPKGMIGDYTSTSVGRVLTDMGLSWKVENIEGRNVLFANVYGMTVLFLISNCDDPANPNGCTDLRMISVFKGRSVSPTNLMRFNSTNVFAFAGSGGDDEIFFRRFDFEIHGVTRENLRTSILSFRLFAEQFFGSFRMSVLDAPSTRGLSVRPSNDKDALVLKENGIISEDDADALIDGLFAKDDFINTLTDAN